MLAIERGLKVVRQTVKSGVGKCIATILSIAATYFVVTKNDALLIAISIAASALLILYFRHTKNTSSNTDKQQSHKILKALDEVIHGTIPTCTEQFKRELESIHTLITQSLDRSIRNFRGLAENCNHEKQKILEALEKTKQLNISLLDHNSFGKAQQELDEYFNQVYRIDGQATLLINDFLIVIEMLTNLASRLLNELSSDKDNYFQNNPCGSLKIEIIHFKRIYTENLDIFNKYFQPPSFGAVNNSKIQTKIYRLGSGFETVNFNTKHRSALAGSFFRELSNLAITVENTRSHIFQIKNILEHDMATLVSIFDLTVTLNRQTPNCLSRLEDINHRAIRLTKRGAKSNDLDMQTIESMLTEIYQINSMVKSLNLVTPD